MRGLTELDGGRSDSWLDIARTFRSARSGSAKSGLARSDPDISSFE